ncbi:MAG: zinc ABC transporter substrate-binding protein [Candidatus Lokiarchaeota archaeon]|nr:zinc ABC transporter substrate-binding protein [Candidatus Lokiarchaeota archaeon]
MKSRKMYVGLFLFLIFFLSLGFSVNADFPSSSQSSLNIMTTIAIPYDIVKSISGSGATIESIVDSTTDIHSFDGPTPNQLDKMVNVADVIFTLGIRDAEPWLQPIIDDNPSLTSKIVNLTNIFVDGIADPLLENEINEHIWMDPNIVKKMATITTATLVSLDPANSDTFESANATYQAKLDALLMHIEGNKTAYFNGMKVVVNHPSFLYLFELLGIQRLGVIETHEHGSEPDPQHIDELVQMINNESGNVTIVTNPQHSSENAIEIAQATDSKISIMSPIPGIFKNQGGKLEFDFEVLDYISMIEYCMYALRNPVDSPKTIPGYRLIALGMSIVIGTGVSLILVGKRVQK